ncbi:MAG: TIGR04282 family arsenosugar biosynthesis glycosyltransferase [Gemmatimonadota bacterium]|nr:MAG: TIGR04282 family arsenosugar biosynthesis glycosyltransferase [Gemmatimonadota bacterium]
MDRNTLVGVFAKPASPGAVKTRLIPPLTPQQAAELHLAMLADVIATARAVSEGQVELWIAGAATDIERFRALYSDIVVRAQEGDELGARLARAFASSFANGYERVAIVGSDHPTLPAEYLIGVLCRLEDHDVCLGPSRDGGYYAVGVRRSSWPRAAEIFRAIPWSTASVLQETLERAREACLDVWVGHEWYDVDGPDDLELLRVDAREDSAAGTCLRRLEGNAS